MLNLAEEIKFAELREKCRELKVMTPPEVMISLKVTEKNKTIFEDVQRGHSWTRNFYNFMFSIATNVCGDGGSSFGAGYISIKDTNGAIAALDTHLIYAHDAGFGNTATTDLFGIVVGTGDTAFSTAQFKLATGISAGNSAGMFAHQEMVFNTPDTYNAGTKLWTATMTRVFNNNSGGAITVKESGLIWMGNIYSDSNRYTLMERSVLSPTINVPDGAQLTVSYAISTSFAAID